MKFGRNSETFVTPAFVRQLTDAQFPLFSYIFLLVGDSTDARDVLQDTNLALLRSASHFKPGTSFLAWAKTVAHYQVLTYRKKQSRDRLVFDDEVFRRLTDHLTDRPERANRRLDAVGQCIRKLTETQQALVTAKYFERLSVAELAERFEYSPSAVVSLLYRIRRLLAECIQTTLQREDMV